MQPHVEIVISDSISGAMKFAKQMGWDVRGTNTFIKPGGGQVHRAWEREQLLGHRRGVVHVAYFIPTTESRALRRHLINVAENNRLHIIPYDLSGDVPEPLRICLICGATTPCMWQEDLQPEEPGVPCTFDPTPLQLFQRLRVVERENVELRQDLAAIGSAIGGVEAQCQALWSEIEKIKGHLKAYRSPSYAERARDVPGERGAPHEDLPQRAGQQR